MQSISDSPIAAVGTIVLWLSFLVAGFAIASGIVGNAKKRRRLVDSSVAALYAFFGLAALASALMVYAFVTHDYSIRYVAHTSDTSMPIWYKITAYWGALEGSLLFWVAVLAAFSAIAIRMNRRRHADIIGYVVATIMVAQLFFLLILIYYKNPFAPFLTPPPQDGEGLNPLLQTYWMVIHPPSLYIGFVAATIPFAFGIASLASGRLDDKWLASVRSWTLVCFFFLTLGLILGGRWAYEELGWGGYWAWDPVENAGLIPWFTATAFLHSIMIQEQRSMMKVWNLTLVILTFLFTIFGTFMTRSGIVQSVHAFGEDPQLALLFGLFMIFILVFSFGLLIYRLPKLRASGHFESFVSREVAFLLNNWILLGCAAIVLFVTMFPTLSEWMTGKRVTVGEALFNRLMTPFGLLLVLIMAAAPLLAWRRTTRDRLIKQFAIPVGVAVVTIAVLAIFVPDTRVRTSVLVRHRAFALPISLMCFGLVGFVFTCIGQEYLKGVRVRMRQTKGDPFTSLIGLVLAKRRKYGGYLVHLGVALMFLGFAGRAYESKANFAVEAGDQFTFNEFSFVYDGLQTTSDEHKRETKAKLTVFPASIVDGVFQSKNRPLVGTREFDRIATMYPAKRVYVKKQQPTTEVAIKSLLNKDIYLILDGYDEVEGKTVANIIVKVNPLINWVWLGFVVIALGVAICLIRQEWVDGLFPKRIKGRVGRAVDLAIILLVAGAVTFGMVKAAQAQGAEYSEQGHNDDGRSYAHLCQPENSTEKRAMKELICMCGGCSRETLYECRCATAARERCNVKQLLANNDVREDFNQAAYDDVLKVYTDKYGEATLATPKSKLSWAIPVAAVAVASVVIAFIGMAWVRRGQVALADMRETGGTTVEEDDEYADLLDDELRDTD